MHKDSFSDWCKSKVEEKIFWNDMKKYLHDNLGFWSAVQISDDEEKSLYEKFEKVFIEGTDESLKTWYHDFNIFSEQVFKLLNSKTGYYWTSHTHTGNHVPIFAIGVGAEKFASMNDNTDISKNIMTAIE